MFRVLRFQVHTSLADVVRAVRRTPAQRIALVFPLGLRTPLANLVRMEALAEVCREHRKEATIVGGDDRLRAYAVACGLRAAVILDDWRDARPARSSKWAKGSAPAQPQLVLLPPPGAELAAHEPADDDDEPFDDPPAYLRELLALHGRGVDADDTAASANSVDSTEDGDGAEVIRVRRPFAVAPRMTTLAYDIDSGALLRSLAEDDEERLTATIRKTSGLKSALVSGGWSTREAEPAAAEGEPGRL
jgi:hypothetical protein